MILFCALAISFQWLSAERLTSFSLKWACDAGGEGGYSKVCPASLLLEAVPDLAATEVITKMTWKSLICQLDPQCCGLAFGVGAWRGEKDLRYSSFKLCFKNSLCFLLMCGF